MADGTDQQKGSQARQDAPPSRGWALAMTLCVPGAGHFYLGLQRRAAAWVVLPPLVLLLCLLVLVRSPALYWTFVLVMGLTLGARFAALIDVLALRAERFRRVPWLQVVLFSAVALAVVTLVPVLQRHAVAEAFKVPSGAMQPTLLIQDHILVDKGAFSGEQPKRGDIYVYEFPEDRRYDYVHRVIALPGDRLEVVDGRPWINGWQVPHCSVGRVALPDGSGTTGMLEVEYLGDRASLIFLEDDREASRQGPYLVTAGEVWMLGDNRRNSADSRSWFEGKGGGVPLDHLKGRARFRWLTFNDLGWPAWSRMFGSIDEPVLPFEAPGLREALQACLTSRPSMTVPPAPH